jgi:transposase InsO family protein
VAEAFANTWVVRFGAPRLLHQNNGSEFTAEVFLELCKLLGIRRTTTVPYYPKSNGQVERVNQTLKNLLKCICTDTGRDWADARPWAAAAYRASQQKSTRFTPNRMVFGREVALPLDTLYTPANEVPSCTSAYVQWLQGTLRYVHATARRYLDAKLRGQKQYFDSRVNRREFSIGDQVLWPHHTKLKNVWQGPYLVVEKAVEWNHYTVECEGKHRKVAACQLKRFHSD